MNQKGNLFIMIIIGFLIIALLPPVVMFLFKPADLVMKILLVFVIYGIVRGYLGQSIMTLVISAILIYFLVIKYAYLTASVFVLQALLMVGFGSVIVWGLASTRR